MVLVSQFAFAQMEIQHRKVFYRLGIGPVLSFYKNNPYHSSSNVASAAYQFSFITEFRVSRRTAFLTGLEYFMHGLSFNSYYFPPGTNRLYNDNFNYHYSVVMNEINLPLLVRFNPHLEEKHHFSPYTSFGYDLRYTLLTHLNVKSNLDGTEPFDGFTKTTFEHPYYFPQLASFLAFNVGVQKTSSVSHKGVFFEINFKYGLTRFLIDDTFTPGSLYIRNYHLAFTLGCKI